jgi:chemotaxis protein CheD
MQLPNFGNVPITEIVMGEHYVTLSNRVIKTLLGSCIAVCLYDPKAGVVGMNHFMLASGMLKQTDITGDRAGCYGVHAMVLLINGMTKLGADKQRMQSKVFGGGNVVQQLLHKGGDYQTVGEQNIAFTFEFLKNEGISIVSHDTGGQQGRVIYFNSTDFSVYRSLISPQQEIQLEKKERSYYEDVQTQGNNLN